MTTNTLINGSLQKLAVRYRSELIVPEGANSEAVPYALVAAFLRNVEALGFQLSPDVVQSVLKLTSTEFKEWGKTVIAVLKESKGANFTYRPMYPNFPKQVAEASDTELLVNAVMHYFGDAVGVRIMPVYEKEERFPFYEGVTMSTLGLAAEDVVVSVFANLVGSSVAYSEADIDALEAVSSYLDSDGIISVLNSVSIPNKENFAHLAGVVRDAPEVTAALLSRATTVTDLLRVGAVYSDAHPSLKDQFRFENISRPQRRAIVTNLRRLEGNCLEDFNRNRELWKRFSERLHVSEFVSDDTELVKALSAIRSSRTITTWGTGLEKALSEGDVVASVELLAERPGEFARRLNKLLTGATPEEVEYVVSRFESVSDKVSTTVLLQVIAFFRTILNQPDRKFSTLFTGSVTGSAFALPRETSTIGEITCVRCIRVAQKALATIYAERGSLGKVFYDCDGSYNPVVPFGLRNSSTALRVVGRGTRSYFDTNKTIRFFIHWRDQALDGYESRVDLDLSAVFMDSEFNKLGLVSYHNLRDVGALHSGDVTSAPNGASEFIDVDIQWFRRSHNKARYVAMVVNSYTGQNFSDLDEVLAGFMTRADVRSGEVYEPKSVENAFTVNSSTNATIPVIFDIVTGEAIFTDVPVNSSGYVNNASNMQRATKSVLTGLVNKESVTYHDVIVQNLLARAEVVSDPAEADMVITLRGGTSSISFDDFLAKWL